MLVFKSHSRVKHSTGKGELVAGSRSKNYCMQKLLASTVVVNARQLKLEKLEGS
jgi:hypothetical protein